MLQARRSAIFSSAALFIGGFVCLCVVFFQALHFVSRVGLQQGYFCFAHLSPYCLLCHGTVNVSDSDRSCWTSSPPFVLYLFCYPSLALSLHLWEASSTQSLSGSQVYTLEGEKGFKQTASLLLR